MPKPFDRINYTERIRAFLTARPGEWLLSDVLALVGGKCGWRTRTSECRIALEAAGLGTIENKLTRPRNDDGEVIAVRSWYRFVPAAGGPQDVPGVRVLASTGFTPPAGMPVYRSTPRTPAKPVVEEMGRLF